MNHRQLVEITSDYKKAIEFLMENNLVEDKCRCITCGNKEMKLKFSSGLYKWKCSKCKGSEFVLKESLFYELKMKLHALLDHIYFWSVNLTQTSARNEISTKSKQTTQKWFDKLKGFTYDIMKDLKQQKIGSVGSIIEIDKGLFSKRKYNVGRLVRRVWIVGGIDIRTRDTFFVEVIKRDAETLENIILENVLPGTTIYTDCWKDYINLDKLGYNHLTVNHSHYFIDPEISANTQLIENSWGIFKRKIHARGLKMVGNIGHTFTEFLFKKRFGSEAFIEIMRNIKIN